MSPCSGVVQTASWTPHARVQPRPEARARHERTLAAGACIPFSGAGCAVSLVVASRVAAARFPPTPRAWAMCLASPLWATARTVTSKVTTDGVRGSTRVKAHAARRVAEHLHAAPFLRDGRR